MKQRLHPLPLIIVRFIPHLMFIILDVFVLVIAIVLAVGLHAIEFVSPLFPVQSPVFMSLQFVNLDAFISLITMKVVPRETAKDIGTIPPVATVVGLTAAPLHVKAPRLRRQVELCGPLTGLRPLVTFRARVVGTSLAIPLLVHARAPGQIIMSLLSLSTSVLADIPKAVSFPLPLVIQVPKVVLILLREVEQSPIPLVAD